MNSVTGRVWLLVVRDDLVKEEVSEPEYYRTRLAAEVDDSGLTGS